MLNGAGNIALGQTEWKDRSPCLAPNDQLNPSVALPSQPDFTVSVWEDERDSGNTGADIYIQRIDNITGVSTWIGDKTDYYTYGNINVVKDRFDGIAVCTAPEDQRNPRAAYDGIGGVVVVWEDYRNGFCEVYAQRIDLATGRPDPAWPADGIPVCQTGARSERPRVVGTVDGVFITWIDYRNDPGTPPYNRDIFLQYIQSATASWPPPPTAWVQNGIQVASNTRPDQINPELDTDNIFVLDLLGNMTQGVVVTYQDDRFTGLSSGQPVWTVFANRIDANGAQMYTMGMPPWTADVAAAPSFEHQEYPRIVTTGKQPNVTNQSAVIVWQDMIENPVLGYTDIFAQRLDASGLTLFGGATGLPVCQVPLAQRLPQPVLWESGDPLLGTYVPYVTVGWIDYRNATINGTDIFGGLIMANTPGVMVNPQGPMGEAVCALPYGQNELTMDNLFHNDKNNEYTVFAWTHPTAAGKDIRYQKIALPAWIEQWPVGGWPVTEAKSDQILPQANREVFVWQDGRRDPIPYDPQDDENIYCQTPGDCTGPTQMNWRDVFARWAFGTDAREFRYVTNPEDGSTFVVWTEDRDPYNTPQSIVFIQKFDKDGVPRWSNNGVAVNGYNLPQGSASAKLPDVCISDQGSAIVVHQQTNSGSGREECMATKFDATGENAWVAPALYDRTWKPYNSPLDDSYTEPRILSSGNGNAVVAVLDSSSADNKTFPHIFSVASNGANWSIDRIDTERQTTVTDNHDLRFVFNGINAYYTLTRSWSQPLIVCGAYDPSIIPLNPPFKDDAHAISYVGFDSYDAISRDYLLTPNFSELSFAYSIQSQAGGSYDVWVGRYGYVSGNSTPPVTYQVTMNMPSVDSKMPAIAADSVVNTQSGKQGLLLAWDTETHAPGYPVSHRVESNRFKFAGAMQPEFLTHLILANGLSAPSHPDIARVIGTAPLVSPAGVVVWEGGGELGPCTPARPTEIYGQYVIYDRNAPNPGPQWSQAELIAPGTGNYHQTRPMVDQSMPGGVAVFWYDGQTGNKSLMGTRLPELHTDIGWAKDRGKEVPAGTGTFSLGAVWPQPAQTLGAPVSVTVDAATGRTAVLELHDLLGRKIATLFEGEVKDSGMLVRFTPADYRLAPGVYLLRFSDGEKQQVKPITLIR